MNDAKNEELFPWETDGVVDADEPAPQRGATGPQGGAAPVPEREKVGTGDAQPPAASPTPRPANADAAANAGSTADAPAEEGLGEDGPQAEDLFEAARARAERAFAPLEPPVESAPPSAPIPAPRERRIAAREYYSISEVCEITGLKQHVLRYWETQFTLLNPSKNRSGNRVYQRKEIRLILLVKKLLYEEKYTIEGAKAKLEQLRGGGELADATGHALDRHMLQVLRGELRQLAEMLTPPPAP